MRRLVDDADAREHPLEILKEKISVFEEAEHAQIHTHANHKPPAFCMSIFRFANLTAQPEIHRRRGKNERDERRSPRAIESVTRMDEEIFAHLPRSDAPIRRDYDREENNEGERIKKHGGSRLFLFQGAKSFSRFRIRAVVVVSG